MALKGPFDEVSEVAGVNEAVEASVSRHAKIPHQVGLAVAPEIREKCPETLSRVTNLGPML